MDFLFSERVPQFQFRISSGNCGLASRFSDKKTQAHQKSVSFTLVGSFASLSLDPHIFHATSQG